MGPGGDQHGTDALRQHSHVLFGNVVLAGDMFDEGLHVAHAAGETRAVAAGAGRLAMASGIPGEEVMAGQFKLIDQMGHTSTVFVAAMEQHHGAARLIASDAGRPVAVMQLDTVVGGKTQGLSVAHGKYPYLAQRASAGLRQTAADPVVEGIEREQQDHQQHAVDPD
ncbi:hypothetical protein D3C72_1749120 [compost metagenome]